MKKIILGLLLSAAVLVTAQTGDPVKGNAWVTQQPVTWGRVLPGTSLYVLNTTFRRDSLGTLVALDTTRFGSAGQGACSNEFPLQAASTVQPNQMVVMVFRIRGTDVTQSAVVATLRHRWYDPVGIDTNYVDSSKVWDSTNVINTVHIARAPTGGATWDARFGANGSKGKVCITRGNVGSGDTVQISKIYVSPL